MTRLTKAVTVIGVCVAIDSGRPAGKAQTAPAAGSAVQEANDRIVRDLAARIAGHEGDPAEQVFKNIQQLKGVRAGLLLTIMNAGYAKALGVACSHCHVAADFASDEQRPKRAAREMIVMHRSINQQLAKMVDLATPQTQNRAINCITCHRGAVNPMQAGGS